MGLTFGSALEKLPQERFETADEAITAANAIPWVKVYGSAHHPLTLIAQHHLYRTLYDLNLNHWTDGLWWQWSRMHERQPRAVS